MSILLSIETATSVCAAALHVNGKLIDSKTINSDKSHSTLLLQFVEELLQANSITKKDLSAIAISEGPGSYTGLRIGLSTAKGLCYALDIPLIAVNTLDAMALQVSKTLIDKQLACPMIDARRMEVYTALYNNKNERVEALNNVIIDEDTFENQLKSHSIIIFGNGAEKCKGVMTHENVSFIDNIEPSAIEIGELGYAKFLKNAFENVAYFEPNYFKEFYSPAPKNKTLLNLVRKS